ncbi:MAG: SMC family ATPase [Candidatus Latescibacteria bacterium]|nr:SMC family ATPase [Candidatus Latescibacterota bacterium]
MIPLSLALHNFLSYGPRVPVLDFTQFKVACLTGGNGHGKSALLDAITYALWGEARKSQHERRPDEGLLRLGAAEMRVEFCFALDEDRFRVIRSFRKGRRQGMTQLELQVFDPAGNTYKTLSENASLIRTQERIDQLLCMTYDTFINSAFILQGRADEFTQKGARQRKEILADLLGLSRYDRLQELARRHQQEGQLRCQGFQRQLQEMDVQLAQQGELERQLRELTSRLEVLAAQLQAGEARLEEWREERLERAQLQRRSAVCQEDRQRLGAQLDQGEKERLYLTSQLEKDGEVLKGADLVQRDFADYQQLVAQESHLALLFQSLRGLEGEARQVENQLLAARHEVEQRRSSWEARRHTLEDQLNHFRTLLEGQAQSEERYQRLLATRQQLQQLEAPRLRHEALQHEERQLRERIAAEAERLAARREELQRRIGELLRRLQQHQATAARREELAQELETLQLEAQHRDQLREEGSSLRTRQEQVRRHLETQRADLAKAREKLHLFQTAPQASCPLCGSRLDEAHRQQLDQELAQQERGQEQAIAADQQQLQALEDQLVDLRQQYQRAEQQAQLLPALQQEWGQLEALLAQFAEAEAQKRELDLQLADLEAQLREERFAPDQRLRLAQLAAELSALGYRPEQYDSLRQQLELLAPAETERAHLQEARLRHEQLRAELEDAVQKLEAARLYLEEKRYGLQEQRALEELQRRLRELGYDPARHQQVRLSLDRLSDAVARRERLIAAQQRHAASREQLEKNALALAALRDQLGAVQNELAAAQTRLQELAGAEERFAETSQELARQRAERDQLLLQQGAVQTRHQRGIALAQERKAVWAELERDQREAWVYQQLAEALGKDGIQALIIESAIPEIEQEANALLGRLTDHRIQISIESLRDLKKGGTRETLDIKIADELGERSYHLYSGGEAFRTDFALRLALSKVLARRAGARLRTLIIDEGFGTQDSQGLEYLVEAIQEISKDFDKVLVVTHLSELKKAFPVQIEVTKHPELGSRFEIIYNG